MRQWSRNLHGEFQRLDSIVFKFFALEKGSFNDKEVLQKKDEVYGSFMNLSICLFAFVCLCSYMSCRHAIQNPLFPKLFVYNSKSSVLSSFVDGFG